MNSIVVVVRMVRVAYVSLRMLCVVSVNSWMFINSSPRSVGSINVLCGTFLFLMSRWDA